MAGKLIFIYNADSGLFNTVTDIAHKIFSPETYSCNLCALTHDYFTVRDEWKAFIAGLGVECEFLHRDELQQHFPDLQIALPALLRQDEGTPRLCLSAEAINRCSDLASLKQAITESCLGSQP
jgi:hypothetical protein